jgi:hypothetical protein
VKEPESKPIKAKKNRKERRKDLRKDKRRDIKLKRKEEKANLALENANTIHADSVMKEE